MDGNVLADMTHEQLVGAVQEAGGGPNLDADHYSTYFNKDTGAYIGSYCGPLAGTIFEGHPSLPGQVGCRSDKLDLKTMTLIKGEVPPPPLTLEERVAALEAK